MKTRDRLKKLFHILTKNLFFKNDQRGRAMIKFSMFVYLFCMVPSLTRTTCILFLKEFRIVISLRTHVNNLKGKMLVKMNSKTIVSIKIQQLTVFGIFVARRPFQRKATQQQVNYHHQQEKSKNNKIVSYRAKMINVLKCSSGSSGYYKKQTAQLLFVLFRMMQKQH